MICQYCNKEHDGSYTTGRFCNSKCAHGFSTRSKRKEINKKVSKTLTKLPFLDLVCERCGNKFKKKHFQRFCGSFCRHKSCSAETRKKLSEIMIKKIAEGLLSGRLKSIRCQYKYQNKFIRCDSKVEYSCLNYFEKNCSVIDIERCLFSIDLDGIHKYIPDFKISTDKGVFIVECKADLSSNKSLKRKWEYYYSSINLKKEKLQEFCLKNNFIPFFYTKDLNRKFYYSCHPLISPRSDKPLKG